VVASSTCIAPPDQLISSDETTANTLTSASLELAKYSDIQKKIREEIRATRAAVRVRGETDLPLHADRTVVPIFVATRRSGVKMRANSNLRGS